MRISRVSFARVSVEFALNGIPKSSCSSLYCILYSLFGWTYQPRSLSDLLTELHIWYMATPLITPPPQKCGTTREAGARYIHFARLWCAEIEMDSFGFAHKGSRSRSRADLSRSDLSSWFVLSYSPNPQTRNYNLFRTKRSERASAVAATFCISNVFAPATQKKIQIHFGWISDLKAWVSCLIFRDIPLARHGQTDSRLGN